MYAPISSEPGPLSVLVALTVTLPELTASKWEVKTEAAFTTAGIPMRKVGHEVDDGDMEYDIGEVWTDGSAVYTDKI